MSAGGQLAALQQQVDALQRQINQLSGDESLSPNYLTVTPGGQVGANFTGLINALGLIIPASTFPTPGAQNSIQWIQQSNGAQVASVGAGYTGAGGAAEWIAFLTDPSFPAYQAQHQMEVNEATGGSTNTIQVTTPGNVSFLEVSGTPSYDSITVQAGGVTRTIIDSSALSNFAQFTGSSHNCYIDFGVTSVSLTAGWNSYVVNYNVARSAVPVFLYSVQPGSATATIASTEVLPSTASTTVDINSAIAQPGNIWWMTIGQL